jgi:hypothetical protein
MFSRENVKDSSLGAVKHMIDQFYRTLLYPREVYGQLKQCAVQNLGYRPKKKRRRIEKERKKKN